VKVSQIPKLDGTCGSDCARLITGMLSIAAKPTRSRFFIFIRILLQQIWAKYLNYPKKPVLIPVMLCRQRKNDLVCREKDERK